MMIAPSRVLYALLLVKLAESYYPSDNSYGYHTYRWRQDELAKLNNNACSRFEKYTDKTVIDIKASQDLGAKLLDATVTADMVACAQTCCGNPSCDLGLFRVARPAGTTHNCYMVQCTEKTNCVMVTHGDFVSFVFNPTAVGRENSPIDYYVEPNTQPNTATTTSNVTVSTSIDTLSSVSTPSPTKTHSHTAVPDSHTTESDSHTMASDFHTAMPGSHTTMPDSHTTTSSSAVSTLQPSQQPSTGNESDIANKAEILDKDSNNQNNKLVSATSTKPSLLDHHQASPPITDECKLHGCNGGSGIIVIAVVGCVAFIVVFLVSVAVIRKLYSNRRKKHYHNVDYLINGMYT